MVHSSDTEVIDCLNLVFERLRLSDRFLIRASSTSCRKRRIIVSCSYIDQVPRSVQNSIRASTILFWVISVTIVRDVHLCLQSLNSLKSEPSLKYHELKEADNHTTGVYLTATVI